MNEKVCSAVFILIIKRKIVSANHPPLVADFRINTAPNYLSPSDKDFGKKNVLLLCL
jgi:hypothetical protein